MHQSFDPETRALFLAQNLHLSPTLEYFGQIYSSRQESEEVTLEGLISASWERKASDPRDHIYALLGLVTPSSNKLFDADYSKSTSWAYQKAMLYITESRQNLDYLISAAKQGLPREPSWCVDFSRKKQLTYIESSWFQRRYGTNEGGAATGRETCQLLHDIDQSTLTLKGTIVGTVKLITLFAPPTTSKYCGPAAVNALIDKISSLKQLIYDSWASRLGQRIATSKVYAGDIWKLAANGQPGEVLFDEFSDIKDPYTLVAELGDMDAEDVLDGKYTCSDDHFNDIWKVITAITQGSSGLGAFVTGTGYAGSGYVSLQEGDVVVVIFGCRMPLVLRPMDGGMYALVDAVYVDGIMRGEILADEATYIETEFVLR
ncbi:hypothetical protein CC86DRAFT_369069 [Ophiobolus disseminans]|uniref:Heterokaryon incompatibility domain-containing protein n=1 Tax=Ophiobolus disseminans TaxID=1469910 RepID=A0A6A7A3Y0_9PLEO|nr:hypothetical protein CC86DRAFT_369069 [Ophiobolus disseminans]